jgi:hypothetical protein
MADNQNSIPLTSNTELQSSQVKEKTNLPPLLQAAANEMRNLFDQWKKEKATPPAETKYQIGDLLKLTFHNNEQAHILIENIDLDRHDEFSCGMCYYYRILETDDTCACFCETADNNTDLNKVA